MQRTSVHRILFIASTFRSFPKYAFIPYYAKTRRFLSLVFIDRSPASRATPARRRQSALSGRDTPIRLFFMRAIGNPYKNRIFATLCLRPERHGKCKISARLMKPTRKQIWTHRLPDSHQPADGEHDRADRHGFSRSRGRSGAGSLGPREAYIIMADFHARIRFRNRGSDSDCAAQRRESLCR